METVPLAAFRPTVMAIAPTVSTNIAEHFILQCVIEAARRTRSIKSTGMIDMQHGVAEYPIPLEEGFSLISIEQVSVNGVCYTPTRERPCPTGQVIQPEKCAQQPIICGVPCAQSIISCETEIYMECGGSNTFYIDGGQSIILSPVPHADLENGIQVAMAVAPSRLACSVPYEFWENWSENIAEGALSKVLNQMGTKHYNAALAQMYLKLWERSLSKMKSFGIINYVTGDEQITVKPMLI